MEVTTRIEKAGLWCLGVMLLGCGGEATSADREAMAGTYDIAVCAKPCALADTASMASRGFLMLDRSPMLPQDFPDPIAISYRYESAKHAAGGEIPNGCFALRWVQETAAQPARRGLDFTHWTATAHERARFGLGAGPDWHTVARAEIRNGDLHATVRSSGQFVSHGAYYIVGRRTGLPDLGMCIRAAAEGR